MKFHQLKILKNWFVVKNGESHLNQSNFKRLKLKRKSLNVIHQLMKGLMQPSWRLKTPLFKWPDAPPLSELELFK